MQPKSLRLAIICGLAAVALPSAGLLAAGPVRVAPVQLADAALAQSFVGKTLTGAWTSPDHPEWGAAPSTVRIDSIEGDTAKISYSFKGKSSAETGAISANRRTALGQIAAISAAKEPPTELPTRSAPSRPALCTS